MKIYVIELEWWYYHKITSFIVWDLLYTEWWGDRWRYIIPAGWIKWGMLCLYGSEWWVIKKVDGNKLCGGNENVKMDLWWSRKDKIRNGYYWMSYRSWQIKDKVMEKLIKTVWICIMKIWEDSGKERYFGLCWKFEKKEKKTQDNVDGGCKEGHGKTGNNIRGVSK